MRRHIATSPNWFLAEIVVLRLREAGYRAVSISNGVVYGCTLYDPTRVFLEGDSALSNLESLEEIEAIVGMDGLPEFFEQARQMLERGSG